VPCTNCATAFEATHARLSAAEVACHLVRCIFVLVKQATNDIHTHHHQGIRNLSTTIWNLEHEGRCFGGRKLWLLCTSWSKTKRSIIGFGSIDQLYDNELCSNIACKVSTSVMRSESSYPGGLNAAPCNASQIMNLRIHGRCQPTIDLTSNLI